jgi:hypothetical protein
MKKIEFAYNFDEDDKKSPMNRKETASNVSLNYT